MVQFQEASKQFALMFKTFMIGFMFGLESIHSPVFGVRFLTVIKKLRFCIQWLDLLIGIDGMDWW